MNIYTYTQAPWQNRIINYLSMMNIIQCSMFIFRSLCTVCTLGPAFLACDVVWIGFEAYALCSRSFSLSLPLSLPNKHFLPRVLVFVCVFFSQYGF